MKKAAKVTPLKIIYKKPQDKIEIMKEMFLENFQKRQEKNKIKKEIIAMRKQTASIVGTMTEQ